MVSDAQACALLQRFRRLRWLHATIVTVYMEGLNGGGQGLTWERTIVSAAAQLMLIAMLLLWVAVCHMAISDRRRAVLYLVACALVEIHALSPPCSVGVHH